MATRSESYILEMKAVSKAFPGVQALKDVDLAVREGEVHALVGENGAGKSTLIKILSGAHPKDTGEIHFDGQQVEIRDPAHSQQLGIAVIYQEFNLAKHLSVPENIFMGRLPKKGLAIDWGAAKVQAQAVLDRLGVVLPMNVPVSRLTVAEQQLVEIAKALALKSRLMIMDEPSAVLGDKDLIKLFRVIRTLQEHGVTIIYISHRLVEIFQIADRVTVLKDGQYVGTRKVADIKTPDLVRMMIGRELADYPRHHGEPGPVVLEVKHLKRPGVLNDISLRVRAGEIVGVAGLRGAGRTEMARAIFGADSHQGEVIIEGRGADIHSPHGAITRKLGLVTEDRKSEGIFPKMGVKGNISHAGLKDVTWFGWIKTREELRRVLALIQQLNIKTPTVDTLAETLSGGNQQKMVLARWLNIGARVLLLDEPTRGIDVGAKWEIYRLMVELADQGVALIMISSELPEVLGMSDRILVMREGSLVADLPREGTTEEKIMMYATGGAEK
jgi:ribose transport system ATP-binding protein